MESLFGEIKNEKEFALSNLNLQKELMEDEKKKGNKEAYQYHKSNVEKIETLLIYLN